MTNLLANYQLRVSEYFFLSSEDDFMFTIEFYNRDFIFRQQFRWYGDFFFTKVGDKFRLKFDSLTISDSSLIHSFFSQIRPFRRQFESDLDFKYKHPYEN